MKKSTQFALLLLIAVLGMPTAALPGLVPVEDARQDPPEETPEEEPQRLAAWPESDKELERQITKDLARLRKASTEGMEEGGREGLLAAGDAAGPALLKALGKERDDAARARVAEVLTAVTGWPHTRLFAAEFEDRSEHVRLFALERAAAFPDPEIREAAEAAHAAAKKRAGTKREVADELYLASLALASAGSLEGFDALVERALSDWGDSGRALRAATEGLRGPEATTLLAEPLEGDRKHKVAALRLLAGCGDAETAVPLVRPYLDSTDNSIRVAAINALRGIVDGDLPLERMSVFEAVELAGKWKERL